MVDEDGSILTRARPRAGVGERDGARRETSSRGEAEINDMYLLINGSRTNFDRRSTELHELGHTLGLAHSSAGWPIGKDGALAPQLEAVATMHPFSIATKDRRSLEPDDDALALGAVPRTEFPDLHGHDHRDRDAVRDRRARPRRQRAGDPGRRPTIQLSRMTGFDGRTDGSYTINGLSARRLQGGRRAAGRRRRVPPRPRDVHPHRHRLHQEFLNKSKEGDCAAGHRPNNTRASRSARAGRCPRTSRSRARRWRSSST